MPTIKEHFRKLAQSFYDRLPGATNPLIQGLGNFVIDWGVPSTSQSPARISEMCQQWFGRLSPSPPIEYQNELPKKIKSRGKDAHLIHEELVQTMKWKQTRGKFYPQLSYLVKVNTPRAVMMETKKAFKKLPNLEQAITALSNLKGVGTTMASALLAAAAPDQAPFMADECLMAIPEIEGIDYTTKEYLKFVQHIHTAVERAELVGMVKIGSHQENLNHNHQSHDSTHCTGRTSNIDTLEYNKRSSVSANRSLPEIPVSLEGARLEPGNPLWETEANGDTSSELYATVQENKHLLVQPQVLVMPTTSTSGTIGLKSMAGDQSQTEDTHLNPEHPYDQLHPRNQNVAWRHLCGKA
uniref:Uncharacterized protein n=1 Tax=Timema genevievae TaxID=629358 RepID=A0A7R9PNJ1_TIMGE|nr:unnamed protein product [Timema genevievae]